jgi:hypothetical protein
LAQLEAAAPEETDPIARSTALGGILQLRTFRGDDVADLVAEIQATLEGVGVDELARVGFAELTQAYVSLAKGHLSAAANHARRFATTWPQGGPEGLRLAARAGLWAGDVEAARTDLDGLQGLHRHGRGVKLEQGTISAGLAALEGRTAESLSLYREALRGWEDLGLPWDRALCAIDMATLLDPREPEVAAAAASARQVLEELGARPFLERLEAALARPREDSGVAAKSRTAPARASV